MAENTLDQMPTEYLVQMIDTQKQLIESQGSQIGQLTQTIASLTETVRQLEKKIFGFSSEKACTSSAYPGQLSLFDEDPAADETARQIEQIQRIESYARRVSGRRAKATHEEIYGDLPVEKEVIPVSGEGRFCGGCGNEMIHLGEKYVREEIRITPAVVMRVQIYQETVICKSCKEEYDIAEIFSADVPEALVPHSMASPSAVSYVMYQKCSMGSPLYRRGKDFEQMGVHIGRSTMANRVIICGDSYLFRCMKGCIRSSPGGMWSGQMKPHARC